MLHEPVDPNHLCIDTIILNCLHIPFFLRVRRRILADSEANTYPDHPPPDCESPLAAPLNSSTPLNETSAARSLSINADLLIAKMEIETLQGEIRRLTDELK